MFHMSPLHVTRVALSCHSTDYSVSARRVGGAASLPLAGLGGLGPCGRHGARSGAHACLTPGCADALPMAVPRAVAP